MGIIGGDVVFHTGLTKVYGLRQVMINSENLSMMMFRVNEGNMDAVDDREDAGNAGRNYVGIIKNDQTLFRHVNDQPIGSQINAPRIWSVMSHM